MVCLFANQQAPNKSEEKLCARCASCRGGKPTTHQAGQLAVLKATLGDDTDDDAVDSLMCPITREARLPH